MVTGWRRAFCTSIPKDPEFISTKTEKHHQEQQHCNSTTQSPKISSKFGFFSNPSTPRSQSQQRQQQPPISTTSLRCRTTATAPPISSSPNSPKLQCKTPTAKKSTTNSPRLFQFSNPSSPKSPSSFSLLKATLRLSKSSRCGICLQSVKSGQGTAIFTAECSHVFHFPCVTSHVKKHHLLVCPVCNTTWKEPPLLSSNQQSPELKKHQYVKLGEVKAKTLRVYNDDEPLRLASPGSVFNAIPELEENDVGDDNEEFQGFHVNPLVKSNRNVECSLLPESAVVAVGRSHETHVVVMRVRAPPVARGARRAPVDLVAVLDVSEGMLGVKSMMLKRVMKLIVSSLTSTDRLSVVAFSANSKRLLPLRLMSANGRRSARRVVDALGNTGQGMSVSDALKKAAKVIEDRREKNPVATILIISDGQQDRSHINSFDHKRPSSVVHSTSFSHSDILVHSIRFGEISAYSNAQIEEALRKCVNGVLNVVAQDVNIQLGFNPGSAPAEIPAVYSISGRPGVFGPGSVRLGDFHAEEERDLLVELRVPTSSTGSRHVLFVQSSLKDPASQELLQTKNQTLLLPRAQAVRSSVPGIQRLRNIHISTRAVAESRRLVEHGDLSGSYHLLSSARALLLQSTDVSAGDCVRGLEGQLAEVQRKRQHFSQRQRSSQQVEEKLEPLTPTSAWRAAERLAKVAIMRKHMNRVSDLHGFENARF